MCSAYYLVVVIVVVGGEVKTTYVERAFDFEAQLRIDRVDPNERRDFPRTNLSRLPQTQTNQNFLDGLSSRSQP